MLRIMIFYVLVVISPVTCLAFEDTSTVSVSTIGVVENRMPVLEENTTYLIVEPLTGKIEGEYNTKQTELPVSNQQVILVSKVNGNIVAVLDKGGQALDASSTKANDPLLNAIDKRRGELNRNITAALTDGKITQQQAKLLRDDLDRVGKRQTDDSSNGKYLTYAESIYLASRLNDISDHLSFLTKEPALAPLVSSRFTTTGENAVMAVNDIEYRKAQLRREIDDRYIAGRMLYPDSKMLKDKIDAISHPQSSGQVNADETASIEGQLNEVEKEIQEKASAK